MKTRNIISIAIIGLVILFQSCEDNFSRITGEGRITSHTLSLQKFTGIKAKGVDDIHISFGPVQQVEVVGHPNIIARIEKDVVGDIWHIELENGNYGHYELTYYITLPYIDYMESNGTGDIIIEGDFSVDEVDVILEGTGDFEGFSMLSKRAYVDITGTGSCEITAAESLNATLEGSGSVYYEGYPVVSMDIRGSGKVINAND